MKAGKLEVTITVKRGDEAEGKIYQLKEASESRKGTFIYFQAVEDNTDLPDWGKYPIKAERGK